MKLNERLPDGVTVDGKFYKCDFDFRNVFEMQEILSRNDLLQPAREYKALKCVIKHPKNVSRVLVAVKVLLFGEPSKNAEKTAENKHEKITDFKQDAPLIRAAFYQAYGIDLYREKIHWIKFTELLNSIPSDTRYAEVLSLRARPVPKPTKWNMEERASIIRAKAAVALEMSEEQRKEQYAEGVKNAFAGLMNFYFGGSEK